MNPLSSPTSFGSHKQTWRVLLGVSMASFLGCIDFTIVNTVIPDIQTDLHVTIDQSQWIMSIFLMALCACMVVAGRMADLYGRRLLLYIGMVMFGASSAGAGLATQIDWLIACRLVQGMSCAVLYTASTAIVSHAYPEGQRGKALGVLFGANGIGLAIGPVVGGLLVGALGWRAVFWVNVPLILLSLAICLGAVQESRSDERDRAIDWSGLILLVAAIATLLLGITRGAEWTWLSPRTLSCFGFAGVSMAAFVRVERHAVSPIIRIELFLNRQFIVAGVATFALAFFYCAAFFLMPLYLRTIGHFDGFMIGAMLLPTTAVMALASPLVGSMCDRYGARSLIATGFTLFAASAAMQSEFSAPPSLPYIIVAFALMGLGWACILGPSTVSALSSVPEKQAALAMGASWTLHNLGGAIGLSIASLVYQYAAQNRAMACADIRRLLTPGDRMSLVSNPATAVEQLMPMHFDPSAANRIVEQFFLQGYWASMCLLLGVSVLTCVIVLRNGRCQSYCKASTWL